MFENYVMRGILSTDYAKWRIEQDKLDNRFFDTQGDFTKHQYLLASMELLVEYIPKEANVSSLQYK